MKLITRIMLVALLCFATLSICSAGTDWDKWNGRIMLLGNFGAKTIVSTGKDAIDTTCTNFKLLGIDVLCLSDSSYNHNLRTWLLTKNEAMSNAKEFMVLPGFTWQGQNTDTSLTVLGSRGFATSNPADPTTPLFPFVDGAMDTNQYAGYLSGGNYAFQEEEINQDLNVKLGSWGGSPPGRQLSAMEIYSLDSSYLNNNDKTTWKYRSNYPPETPADNFDKLADWLANEGPKYSGDSIFCQFCDPWPVGDTGKYFFDKWTQNSALRDMITGCDISSYSNNNGSISIIVDETNYRNVLSGGWKVAPTYCYDDTDSINKGHTVIWVDEMTLTGMFGGNDPVESLEKLLDYIRTNRKSYVRENKITIQGEYNNDFSIRLEANDPLDNVKNNTGIPLATMGEEISSGQKIRMELSIRYKYNSPREKLFLESASFVIVYAYGEGLTNARELSCPGMYNPIKNYKFESVTDPVKDLKFYRNFDNLTDVRCIYGKATFAKPGFQALEDAKDYYNVKKKGGSDAYSIVTAPIYVK